MTNHRPKRLKTRFPATLQDDCTTLNVMLRNISVDGAHIDVDPATPILAGTAMHLQIGSAALPTLVQWSKKGSVGVRFLVRPDPQLINLIPADD